MQQLTPQQNANIQKNVQSLLDSRINSVKVPTTKGTFHNTENGWLNTSSGQWKANQKLENYSVFSVKWGPARHAFTAQGETEQSIKGKPHLYMYFGVDRLKSRNFSATEVEAYTNDSFKLNGLHIDHIYFADPYHWGNAVSKWVLELTPTMYEVNYQMNGSQADQSGKFIVDPKASSTYYSGWVETPWTTYMNEPMYATFFASVDVYGDSSLNTGVSLVLFRGNPSVLRSICDAFPQTSKVAYNNEYDATSNLNDVDVFLSHPVSNPVTIFDEIPSELSNVSNGIAQSHTGGLAIEESRLINPNLVLRECTYTYMLKQWFVPYFSLPQQGITYVNIDNYMYVFSDSLKWRGQNVALKCKQLTEAECAQILTGKFNWASPVDDVLFGVTRTLLNEIGVRIYLNSCKLGGGSEVPRAIDVCARVVYDKQHNLHCLQFWGLRDISNNPTTEPPVPSYSTPVSDWFNWCTLEFPIDSTTTLLMSPADSVVGRLDSSDTLTDSWYGLSAGLSSQFLSLDQTAELGGAGEGQSLGGHARALELFKFNDLEYVKHSVEKTDQYVIRHPDGNGGAVLQYGPLSAMQSNVDTRMVLSVDQNSIDYAELSDGTTYLQFYKFPDNERLDVSAVLSDTTDIVLRHRYLSADAPVVEVDYLSADEVVNPECDTDATYTGGYNKGAYKSLDEGGKDAETGKKVWELYKFKDRSYQTHLSDLVDGCASFVVREESYDTRVNYVPVEELKVKVDTEGDVSKSIEKSGPYGNQLRLYNFLSAAATYKSLSDKPTFKDMTDEHYSVLVRDDDDFELKYFDLRYLSRYGDADINGLSQKSIETKATSNELSSPYFQLADFDSPSIMNFGITLKYDGKAYHATNNLSSPEDIQFVMRNGKNNSKDVQYWDFTITAPQVGMSALTQEVINELTSSHCDCAEKWVYISAVIDDLSAQISGDYWESGGDSGTCYGSDIGNSNGNKVIDLDAPKLVGGWSVDTLSVNTYMTVPNTVDLYPDGCAYFRATPYFSQNGIFSSSLTIGSTTLTEAQLIQLLRLV